MAKCKKCDQPLEVIKFIEVAREKGVMFYNKDFKEVEHKYKEHDRLSVKYYCGNCNAFLTTDEDKALKMLERS